jgi:tetratricopeptide (TPR) repeat protein
MKASIVTDFSPERALEIYEKVLGPERTSVATTLNNLAVLYHHIEKYDEALPLLERPLEIFERKLGPAHPHFKMTEQNIQVLKAKMK